MSSWHFCLIVKELTVRIMTRETCPSEVSIFFLKKTGDFFNNLKRTVYLDSTTVLESDFYNSFDFPHELSFALVRNVIFFSSPGPLFSRKL